MAIAQRDTQYEPLAERDYSLKGFEFDCDAVVIAAMKRWAIKPVGTYENFLRLAYWSESVKADGFVVDLGRDEQQPLTFEEVMAVDPYQLSLAYGDGTYSKHFNGKYAKGTTVILGDECSTCHTFDRYVTTDLCVVCEIARRNLEWRKANPDLVAANEAKRVARAAAIEATRLANEEAAQKAREASAARKAATVVRMAERKAAELEAKLARAAAKEEERIRAARERAAAQEAAQREKALKKAAENKFEGDPCGTCGNTTRYIKDRACVSCVLGYARRRDERAREKRAAQRG